MSRLGVAIASVAGAIVCALVACGDDYGAVDAPPDGGGAEASADVEAGACAVVHVSSDGGDDANDGCSSAAPKKTIAAALNVAGAEVHVCRGTYRETNLQMARPVSLRGGYDCQSWRRDDGFGRKGGFESPNVTQIETPDLASPFASLTIAGEKIGREVIVDGLRVVGRDGAEGSTALSVIEGAKPTLADLQIVGGAAKVSTLVIGSVGLAVLTRAAPEVKDSDVRGGSGQGKIGSIGVRVTDANIDMHDSVVDGGSGVGLAIGALGVLFDGSKAGKGTFTNDVVSWGQPTSEGSQMGAAGMYAATGTVDVVQSAFRGGTARCHSGPCTVYGIIAAAGVKLRATQNLVAAGDIIGVSGSGIRGITLLGTSDALIASNVIHVKSNYTTIGVEADGADATILGNTIVAVSAISGAYGVVVGGANGGDKGRGALVEGNVFGTTTTSSAGLRVLACDGAKVQSVKRNAFVNTTFSLEHLNGPGCATVTRQGSPRDMEGFLGDEVAKENVQVAPACTSPGCIGGLACIDNDACLTRLFPAFDVATSGLANVFVPKGYAVAPKAPCAFAQGGGPASTTVTTDVYGTLRSTPVSIGAAEQDDCTP